ncbi:fibrillin-2-like [Dreissena polymorpha]|uniref:fibrillin-2-like n=1 Tax=Dreissena polymorpha TaxID=45954 RepID=UPI002264712E|nr:fibrillin-2-like [Dreissena polymorpha]
MLSLDVIVPKIFNNRTKGLLGNFDGNSSNDFVYPNGSRLHFNASDMEIFYYGQTWSVNDSSSVFIYDDGKKHSDYHNFSYIPRFLDTVDKKTLAQAEKECNGSKNIECVFDYALTLNKNIAKSTNDIRITIDNNEEEIAKVVPTINNTCSVNATVGDQISCQLKLDDGLDIAFVNNDTKTTFNRTSKTLYFKQSDDRPHNIWFVAINNQSTKSQQHTIQVQLCTGCHGNGHCSTTVRPDPQETAYFKYSACVCDRGYTGDDCQQQKDWCAERPCSLGRNCTNIPQNKTYSCSPCPNGYAGVPGENDCIDINECNSSNPCDHMCLNTEGSYSCDCEQGFRVDANNKHNCIDINECNEATHNCSQICDNTKGSFLCQCQPGFIFNVSNWTCVPDESDPCATSTLNCTQTEGCTLDTDNKTTCFCNAGFIFNRTSFQCQDVNECSQNICPQDCMNTIGSFQCSCITGYQLIDKVSCESCEVPNWGLNCSQTCDCTGRGAEKCDPVRGCVCSKGWTGSSCDDDVNECKEHFGVCEDARKSCTNNIGSYSCDCLQGYVKDAVGNCRDIDECSDPQLNECSQKCLNAEGSYTCGCKHGFTEVNSTHCTDINECDLKLADCEQMCENHPGYFNCYCYFGYRLNDNRNTCSKLKDYCKELNNLTCAGYCEVRNKTASCQCQQGFELTPDKQNCADVDECEEGNKCSTGATCMNTVGSFVCECPVGMKLQNNKRTCTECDKYHYGKECLLPCSCIHGVCNSTVGCLCDPGWTGISCDVDVDECRGNQVVCNETNTHCVNTPGSASCVCQEGYSKKISSGKCEDVNECQTSSMNTCDQECINTPGSHLCRCRAGFVFRNGKCNDINECLGDHECQQKCVNTIGSYRCSCESGFILDLTDRKSCIAEKKCTLNQAAHCSRNANCSVFNGEVICVCPNGYNGTNCTDIDECKNGMETCDQNCQNTIGGYKCECQVGFLLENDNASCTKCRNWTYGEMCSRECKCNVTNTETCNPTNGNCTCLKGWHGGLCYDDVNECTSTSNVCPTNSKCINLSGSFTCECDAGYLKNSLGLCKACPQGRFGKGCTSTCLCDMTHTSVCNTVNGSCTCDAGWIGSECNIDANECASANDFECPANSTCVNSRGSYDCDCDPGFKPSSNGDSCRACLQGRFGKGCTSTCLCDMNHTSVCDTVNGSCTCAAGWTGLECKTDVDECVSANGFKCPANSTCVNTIGSYKCDCDPGFKTSSKGDSCTECSNNTYGRKCFTKCACVKENTLSHTQSCDTVNGTCKCTGNWTGNTCQIDVDECQEDACKDQNALCINTDGSFACFCRKGFVKGDVTNTCSNGTTVAEKKIDLQIKLKIDARSINLTSDRDFAVVAEKVKVSLRTYLLRFITNFQIVIKDLRNGSLVIDFTLFYNNSADAVTNVANALDDLGKGTNITYDGKPVEAISEQLANSTLCGLFVEIRGGPCEYGTLCNVRSGVPLCVVNPVPTDNVQLIIGVSVAGGLILAVGICTVICIVIKRKTRNAKKHNTRLDNLNRFDGQGVQVFLRSPIKEVCHGNAPGASRYRTWRSMALSFRQDAVKIPRMVPDENPGTAGW